MPSHCAPTSALKEVVALLRSIIYGGSDWCNHCGEFDAPASNFWYKIWEEAGCPNAGVLFQIKRNAKRRYKYEVRRLVHRQKQNELATSFAEKRMNSFWTHVRKLNSSSSTLAPTIDGVSGSRNIANVFASKLKDTLNTHSSSFICIPQLN